MQKQDLISDLKTTESAFATLKKGYLFNIPMDIEIYQALVSKLSTEALTLKAFYAKAQTLANLSDLDVDQAQAKSLELRTVINSTCMDFFEQDPAVKKFKEAMVANISKEKMDKILTVMERDNLELVVDEFSNKFKILNFYNQVQFECDFTPLDKILEFYGLDLKDEKSYLIIAVYGDEDFIENLRNFLVFNLFLA